MEVVENNKLSNLYTYKYAQGVNIPNLKRVVMRNYIYNQRKPKWCLKFTNRARGRNPLNVLA